MKNTEKVNEWLRRAKSNLAQAKTGKESDEILYEDLCFNAQQAVEKALKALCIGYEVIFPKSHDLAYLIELLEEKANISLPEELQNVKLLTEYAVETRYPGDYEAVTVDEYQKAIEIAEELVVWVEKTLAKK
jgi:HEPN domain-containing protein